ncbi:uncharacterized protein LOC120928708 [Rana temporaria]|uniref:uncharacterized protein LOC120928708 n=1 Tax=Rana temporaria TaxID=8407 RepID=UPI001AAD50B2|nr:uncharacterized protein LOC120928708 [Rana temporaria]
MNLKESFFIFALSPLTFAISHPISNGTSCMYAVNSSTTVQFNTTATQPFILRCPIQLCTQIPPNITWCKVIDEDTCAPVTLGPRIFQDQEQRDKENDTVHILNIHSARIDDSGLYKCLVVHREKQIVRVIEVRVFDGPSPKPFIGDTSKTWTTYFFIAVRMIIVIVIYALLYPYLREVKANHTLFKRTFSKTKFVSASRTTCKISSENTLDIDPPTESFEMICDGLGEDEMTFVLSPKEETLISGTLQNSKEGTED